MLFEGLRLLVSNWRLTLVQILPAMWIWLAMFDLKAHVLHGKSFHVLRGPVLIPIVLLIVMLTVASFFLNAVFAFTIATPAPLEIRPALRKPAATVPIVLSGAAVGCCSRSRPLSSHVGAGRGSRSRSDRRGRDDGHYVAVPPG